MVVLAVELTALPVDNPSGETVLSIEFKLPCVSIVSVTNLNKDVIAEATFWQGPLEIFLTTLLSEAGVVIVSVTILNKVSIVDLTLSHLALPVCPVLVTEARLSGVEIAFCTILDKVVIEDSTALHL